MSRTLKRNMLQTQTISNNDDNRKPLISKQLVQSFSTHSLINSEFNNDLISSGKSIKQDLKPDLQFEKKNQLKRNNLVKFKIHSNRLFVPLTDKPQFKHVFRKTPAELLYKGDNEKIQSLTKRMFSVYQKQDKEREKRAFEFKLKNSLVSKFAGTMQRPEEVQFCKDVLNHLTKVSKSTAIIPYSIALINPDNGLREQIPTNYNDKLESKEIEVAQSMVKQFKEKARQVGVFNKQIETETSTIKKQRVSKYLKNAMDQLKSMNFAEDGSLDEDTVYWKDQFFYHVKQNNIQDNKMTALHWAVKRNYISMAEMLLKNDSKKDSQDILGRTPIHLAAKLNYFEMTKLLLRYKTNLNIKNKKGLTPVEIAGSDDILNLISKAMRLGVIQRLSLNRPSRALKEAEQKLFRAAGEESD
ncbi:ankyrin repeat-containing protein [Stylonychia lemnae]|uniref:Ankyrin repeat-containing protein n=1 Tax=Stylonychia lemnae TaxID=5949 RepID=A0A078B2W8_STYLE|nr:ankyrin repeat-containing protein [Stylonychia lemnae]|eukprot:CDW87853.1 ankyrin repeat-containing protein [Stylonychia lemnae]